jgi:chemotaxis receptor (MCP) glutamine deamidase CheD
MYADTGMDYVLAKMMHEGDNVSKLRITVVGGACSDSSGRYKDLGRHNYNAIRRYLWVHDLLIYVEECGGKYPRNIFCDIDSAKIAVKYRGEMIEI